ncbi:MAG: hypothetical protein N2689_15470 [Verrucomicrobiae bacterium]|nr:hypothetical protein [Verrucomicrobiae bacterium]
MADPAVQIVNGGFEEVARGKFKGYRWHDEPGRITFQDTQIFKEGSASLRIENVGQFSPQHGHGRIMQEVAVAPRRCYRLSCWVKTEGLRPASAFKPQVLAGGRALAPFEPGLAETGDWRKITMVFNSLRHDRVGVYAGLWGGKEGKVWLDDLRIEEVGPINVLRRPGAPVVVRSEDGGTIYEEGKDFAALEDPRFRPWRPEHDAPALKLLPGGRIRDGERLRVSWYHAISIHESQVSICMSEPKVYDIWRTQAGLLRKHLAPKKFLLSMDEVRTGGSCAACKARKMTMAQILGDCITRQVELLRDANPGAEVYCWSDMLDPNHNARGNYYLVDGDFTGSWNHVPKDLIIVCWYFKMRERSLKFFSDQGFRTLAGAYYDGDTLDNPRGWLEALDRTPNARGIMYTTWRNKYDLLAAFGDLVSRR